MSSNGLIKWIDLRDNIENAQLRLAPMEGDDGRRRHILFIIGLQRGSLRWNDAVKKLGFVASAKGKYLARTVQEGDRSPTPKMFHPVWPGACLSEMTHDKVLLDLRLTKRVTPTETTKEERDVAIEAGVVTRLGRNAEGDEVFSNLTGRYFQRQTGPKIYETDLLGPATFLRAPDNVALNSCADGFVNAMMNGEVQHSDDLDRFIKAVTDQEGPYDKAQYEKFAVVIDAAMVRQLSGSYETAQDAYGDASRLYDYLPPYKGGAKGKAAMALPLSVIAQRLLGDTTEKHVLVPNAWDGASFAFMARGTKIHAFRGSKDLSRNVSGIREEDVTWGDQFDAAREQGADGLFFNADPLLDIDGSRLDYRQALSAMRALNADARAVFVLAGDDPYAPGVLSEESRRFFEALAKRYSIEAAVEIGSEMSSRLGTGIGMRLIAIRNRPAGEHSLRPTKLTVLHSWDELKSSVDETIATIDLREAESEGVDVERLARENEFQRPYVAFSKVGEARTMVPKNLQGPLQYALSQLELAHGPVDPFVERELGFGPNTLGERFSPEQVDAIGLGISRMKTGRGIIIGDETGIGKGRTLSGYCTWAEKQGRDVLFVTDRANLFSDLVRDLRDIDEWGRFRPLIMNNDGVLMDVFTNEVIQKGTPSKVMAKIIDDGLTLEQLQCNIIFTTYSQISNEDSPKAEWLLAQSDRALVIVDEAHIAAGSNSNTSQVVSELVNRAWAVAYSSATWAKTSENLHVFSRAFPETINVASLASTMRTGGEAFSEVFSSMLARDGAFIRREHDLSKIEFSFEVDTGRVARNEALSDKVAEILASMTYVSGDINKLLIKLNSDTISILKSAREARQALAPAIGTGREDDATVEPPPRPVTGLILKSHFGAGSVLYQVMRRFLCVLNADHVADLALKAAQENRKPVIVFEDTGEVFLKRLMKLETIPGIDGEPDILPDAIRAPTIKDLLRSVMKRMGVIAVDSVDDTYVATNAERNATAEELAGEEVDLDAITDEQDEAVRTGRRLDIAQLPGLTVGQQTDYEKGMQRIMKMIDDLPPLPLNAIDIVYARLEEAGLRVGEISGRSIRLEVPTEMRKNSIEDASWEGAKMKILPRKRKKSDVSDTVYGFNFGQYDAIAINRSAATGISLHSSPRFGDTRRRELIEMQIPEDPTNRIQLYGRVNRYDQIVTPRISIATTGIFGEVRQLMQQNKKLARLSANIRSSRENAAEIKNIPDLLNVVGHDVCKRFLEDNGGIRNRLGISEKELEATHVDLARRLTSRIALLAVVEQRMVYDEIYDLFNDTLMRYELAGENPLKAREMDIRASIKSERVVIGVENDGAGSAFDGPVYLKELRWTEPKRPYGWHNVLEFVREGREKMLAAGLVELATVEPQDGTATPVSAGPTGPNPVVMINGAPFSEQGHALGAVGSGVDILASDVMRSGAPAIFDPSEEVFDEALLTPVAEAASLNFDSSLEYPTAALQEFLEKEKAMAPVKMTAVVAKLSRILEAKMRIELVGSKHSDVAQALAASGQNAVKRAHERKLWVEKYLPIMTPGCAVGMFADFGKTAKEKAEMRYQDGLFRDWGVITDVRPPAKGKEAMLTRWKVDILFPGETKVSTYTLASLMEGLGYTGRHEYDVASDAFIDGDVIGTGQPLSVSGRIQFQSHADYRRRTVMEQFRRESSRSLTRDGLVLDGNMYMASEWAASSKLGHGVIYTDDRGVRHRGVWLNKRVDPQVIERMPIRLWSQPMIEAFLRKTVLPEDRGGAAPNGPGSTFLFATNFQAALPFGMGGNSDKDSGTKVLVVPGKAVALAVDKSDLARMLRSLRGFLKNVQRRKHPEYKTYTPEQKALADADSVKVTSSGKKRGEKPVIFISCETDDDFPAAVELLCKAAGIELYVPRHTPLGDLALTVQREYFEARHRKAAEAIGQGNREEAILEESNPQEPPENDANPVREREAA